MVRRIGLELSQRLTQSRESFRYKGEIYNVDVANVGPDLVKVANEKYIKGTRTEVSEKLEPGAEKEFARIEVKDGNFLLLLTSSATPHPTTEYKYYEDGSNNEDANLSGSAPWATPPDEYEIRRRGFRVIDNSISLQISETTGERAYSNVEGWLTGVILKEKL